MGVNPKNLSDRLLDRVSDPAERKRLIEARGLGETASKVQVEQAEATEDGMHNEYIQLLNRHELPFIHANPKKKSTIQKGCPDFTVTGGLRYGYKAMYVEFKLPGNSLSKDQWEYIQYLERCGCYVVVAFSFAQAHAATLQFYGLKCA